MKIGKVLDQLHSIPYWVKRFDELWSTNHKVIDAHVNPPKWTFFGILNFDPYGCRTLKFLHTADIGQGLLAHTANWVADTPKRRTFKIGLKILHISAYNFGGSGPNLSKLYQWRWLGDWVIKWILILQGVPPIKFGRAKMSKIRRVF